MKDCPMPRSLPIGLDVGRLRRARGWTIEHLAERAAISVRSIIRAESGQPVTPRVAGAIKGALSPAPRLLDAGRVVVSSSKRDFSVNGQICQLYVRLEVVRLFGGWVILHLNSFTGPPAQFKATDKAKIWCLSPDGYMRRLYDDAWRVVSSCLFDNQQDAIMRAVESAETSRRAAACNVRTVGTKRIKRDGRWIEAGILDGDPPGKSIWLVDC
jgi:hypothetical protein